MDNDPSSQSSAPGATKPPGNADRQEAHEKDSVADAVAGVAEKLRELNEYVSYYIAARIDYFRHIIRRAGILAALGVVTAIAAGALIVIAIVMICRGIAGAITTLVHYPWLGDLITGGLILGALAGSIYFILVRMAKSSGLLTREKYEARRARQRNQFGRDVSGNSGTGTDK